MDKKTVELIIKGLRKSSIAWAGRRDALKRARKKVISGGKSKLHWQCNKCKEWFRDVKSVEVDHIDEIGGFKGDWNEYISRMFCGPENLQVLCIKCHLLKTKTCGNATLKFERKAPEETQKLRGL